jgi:hypothetical protein
MRMDRPGMAVEGGPDGWSAIAFFGRPPRFTAGNGHPATGDHPEQLQTPPAPAVRENTLYKCTGGGRTVYADAPCGDRVEALVIAFPTAPGSHPDAVTRISWPRCAPSGRAMPHHNRRRSTSARNDSQAVDRCAAIDGAVRQIDAVTRQPLSIPLAEHYRARRKALMDERFSIACNG